jgi:hypothetical protein
VFFGRNRHAANLARLDQAPDVPLVLVDTNGTEYIDYHDETHYGGRWFYLGDYDLEANKTARFHVVAQSDCCSGVVVAANALKVTLWPSCNGVPGTSCHNYPGPSAAVGRTNGWGRPEHSTRRKHDSRQRMRRQGSAKTTEAAV